MIFDTPTKLSVSGYDPKYNHAWINLTGRTEYKKLILLLSQRLIIDDQLQSVLTTTHICTQIDNVERWQFALAEIGYAALYPEPTVAQIQMYCNIQCGTDSDGWHGNLYVEKVWGWNL